MDTEHYISDDVEPSEIIEEVEKEEENSPGIYRYLFYIILLLVIGLFIIWIVISMFTSEPPIVILNQMLNTGLEINSSSD